MTKQKKATIAAAAILIVFQLLGWYLPKALGLDSNLKLWILRVGLWLLGLLAAGLVFLIVRGKKGAASTDPASKDEIDVAMAAARARLAGAKGKAVAKFGRLPIVLIAGPSSAAKTTVIARSGLNPDLLAGEVMRGDAVAPTSALNVWYTQGNLVVEAGGRVTGDGKQWHKLVRYIQPSRLGAVLSRKEQAPRVAIVCFGCDELLKPGASESVPAHAQRLRARLAEASQQMGIRLPVYVLFTKSDRLPYFEDYVRSFTRDEAGDVLGATLTVPPAGNVGHYAERESRRLSNAFGHMFQGLALRRLDLLPRETQEQVKAGAYEFPREFRKVTDLASLFLLELCRPNQLGVSPFLRGFYFTGVRPILVHDVAAAVPAPQARVPAGGSIVDATQVFDPRKLYPQPAAQPVAQTGSRKVPEWVFLERFFKEVVLRDAVARSVTAGGTKVALGRRILLGAATAALVVLSLGMIVSFFANRGLLKDTSAAIADARSLTGGGLPDLDPLQRLDRLHTQSAILNGFARPRPDMKFRWGLYAGDEVQANVRLLYFRMFDALLGNSTRGQLGEWLQALPPTPNAQSDFDGTYNALKAYLVTTGEPDKAERVFLTPELLRFGPDVDAPRNELIKTQFDFYGDELPHGDIQAPVDNGLVERTRAHLHGFKDAAQLYSVLLNKARGEGTDVRWTGQVVQNAAIVPAQFTGPGWQRAQAVLADVQQLLVREPWVLGQSPMSPQERAQIERLLRDRYRQDYIAAWSGFLRTARIPDMDTRTLAASLQQLSSNASPLLRMLSLVSEHTTVSDTLVVKKAFESVNSLSTPNAAAPTEAGRNYAKALGPLHLSLAKIASNPSEAAAVGPEATANAGQVRSLVQELTSNFSAQGDAKAVGDEVGRLLLEPIKQVDGIVRLGPIADINSKRAAFCNPLARLGGQFPFNRSGNTSASLADIKEHLAPGTGTWASYQSVFENLISRQGSRYVANSQGPARPTAAFLEYFNTVANISTGLFAAGGNQPRLSFILRMRATSAVPRIVVNMGGRERVFTPTRADDETFDWDGAALPARIMGEVQGQLQPIIEVQNDSWWLFRVLVAGQVERANARNYDYLITWRRGQITVTGELALGESAPMFQPGALSRLADCPATIAVAR